MKSSFKVVSLIALFGCVFSLTACDDNIAIAHEHTFSTAWEYDAHTHWHPASCEHDDVVSDIEAHTYDSGYTKVASTCSEEGIYVRTCTVCGYVQEESISYDLNGHAYIYEYNDENHWQRCTICGNTTSSEEHNWAIDEELSSEPTCAQSGLYYYYCVDCGMVYRLFQPATGEHEYSYHTWSAGHHRLICDVCGATGGGIESCTYVLNEEESYAQTCGENGKNVYYPCPYCGSTKADETLSATGNHDVDYTQWVVTEEGHWHACANCSQKIDYSGHYFDQYNSYDESEHWYTCDQCGYEATHASHNLVESDVDSTCVEYGYTQYACLDCDYSVQVPYSSLAEHEYDNGVVTLEPTCTEEGETTYTCKVCGATYTESIAPKGHTYTEGEYGYTEDGHYQICVDCGAPSDIEHHVSSDVERVESTCTTDGYEKWSCDVCGYVHEEVLAASHTYDESSGVYVAPTCTEDGFASGTCLICGETQEEILPALGHNLIEDSYEIGVDGHYQECSRCGELILTSSHFYDSTTDICNDCGYEFPWNYTVDNATYEMTLISRKSTMNYEEVVPSHYNTYTITTLGDGTNALNSIRTITLPETITTIAASAFYKTSLSTINFADEGLLVIGNYAFGGSNLSEVIIPDSVTTIGKDAFGSCSSLTKVTIGKGVTSLGEGAFGNCTNNLSEVVINATELTTIPFNCFYNDRVLESINIPDCVTTIESSAFLDCYALQEVVLPTSITTLQDHAFGLMGTGNKAYGIQTIYYLGTEEDKDNIDLGEDDSSGYICTQYTATWLYYSETQPADNFDQYWHYDTTGNPVVWSV
ncbi:MAG: leucine-rich repeat domain-containing protein [Coprobacillus sp.]|nr:leucine-rich repeat domain-containing protein [Coprobacillus sp.]